MQQGKFSVHFYLLWVLPLALVYGTLGHALLLHPTSPPKCHIKLANETNLFWHIHVICQTYEEVQSGNHQVPYTDWIGCVIFLRDIHFTCNALLFHIKLNKCLQQFTMCLVHLEPANADSGMHSQLPPPPNRGSISVPCTLCQFRY